MASLIVMALIVQATVNVIITHTRLKVLCKISDSFELDRTHVSQFSSSQMILGIIKKTNKH